MITTERAAGAPPGRAPSRDRGLLWALGLAVVIVAAEYLARRFALVWLPALGARRVNDMLMMGLAYLGLVWLTIPAGRRTLAALPAALRAIASQARLWQVWAAAAAALAATIALAPVDALLWGGVRLPAAFSPWRWEATVLASAAPLLVPASLLLVNGLLIPIAEEWLWRGLIQPRLVGALGLAAGLLATAALFSLKHAIVDASLGRLLALTAFGLVLGALAARRGWRASALAHALANTAATLLALAAGALPA
jgi:membrane protease YdiL (CAAX protease family)